MPKRWLNCTGEEDMKILRGIGYLFVLFCLSESGLIKYYENGTEVKT